MKDLGTETENARLKVNNFFDNNLDTSSSHHGATMPSNNQGGVTGAVTTVTGTVSNRPCSLILEAASIARITAICERNIQCGEPASTTSSQDPILTTL